MSFLFLPIMEGKPRYLSVPIAMLICKYLSYTIFLEWTEMDNLDAVTWSPHMVVIDLEFNGNLTACVNSFSSSISSSRPILVSRAPRKLNDLLHKEESEFKPSFHQYLKTMESSSKAITMECAYEEFDPCVPQFDF